MEAFVFLYSTALTAIVVTVLVLHPYIAVCQ